MKPYDVQALLAELKNKGLNLVEDEAKSAVQSILKWVVDSAKASPSPFDDVAALVVSQLQDKIMAEIDKIDGQVG